MTNDEIRNPNQIRNPNDKKIFDLEEWTARFGEAVIRFVKGVPVSAVTDSIIRQVVRSSTSIGANYCEADDCDSRKDFKFKIGICRREARETKHWLRMIAVAHDPAKDQARALWQEAKELNLIFGKIRRSVK
ncbi:MAG TPA: four helix bundle protein [Tepidisphaeraceae bacterium]